MAQAGYYSFRPRGTKGFNLRFLWNPKAFIISFRKALKQEPGSLDEMELGVEKWTKEFTSTLSSSIYQAHYKRTGSPGILAARSKLRIADIQAESMTSSSALGAGTGRFVSTPGKAVTWVTRMFDVPAYGYTQELGRQENSGTRKSTLYMVPVLASYRKKFFDAAKIAATLKAEHAFMAPFDWDNWFEDSRGREYKGFYRYTVGAKAVAKLRRRLRKEQGKKNVRGLLSKVAELMFIGYRKPVITAIPGMGYGAKRPPALNSQLVQQYGFMSYRGMETGRWFTRHAIRMLPKLEQMFESSQFQARAADAFARVIESAAANTALGNKEFGSRFKT